MNQLDDTKNIRQSSKRNEIVHPTNKTQIHQNSQTVEKLNLDVQLIIINKIHLPTEVGTESAGTTEKVSIIEKQKNQQKFIDNKSVKLCSKLKAQIKCI